MVPCSWTKATCVPWGALGLPEVKPEPLPVTPEPLGDAPEKVQAVPVGLYM